MRTVRSSLLLLGTILLMSLGSASLSPASAEVPNIGDHWYMNHSVVVCDEEWQVDSIYTEDAKSPAEGGKELYRYQQMLNAINEPTCDVANPEATVHVIDVIRLGSLHITQGLATAFAICITLDTDAKSLLWVLHVESAQPSY